MSLRHKLIRLAHENPELREDILPILKEALSPEELEQARRDRAMMDRIRRQKQMESNPQPTGWRNYNTIGKREFGSTVLQLVESRTPATLSILFRHTNEAEFDRLKKKWWGKGTTVTERGVKGKLVRYRGKTLLIAQIGGKWAMVSNQFRL